MCSVYLCIPSARPPEEVERCLKLWRERGYKIALFIDRGAPLPECDFHLDDAYLGYAQAVNMLVTCVLKMDLLCDWVVVAGDDTEPSPNHTAEEIARQCSQHFGSLWLGRGLPGGKGLPRFAHNAGVVAMRTFGVMQPTADKWGDKQGPYIERVCGSPWIGREFALRINQGKGPLWPDYFHMGEDEELQHVALKYGVLWQRPDLTHYHRHWGRERGMREDMPEFLERANRPDEWRKYKQIFETRKRAGFPWSEPL